MDPERDLALLIVMVSPVDAAIIMLGDERPSRRLEPSAGAKPFPTPLQLPGLGLEELNILRHLDAIRFGDGDGLLDRALQTALVLLPSDLGARAAEPEGTTGVEEPSFEQDVSDPEQEPPGTHRGRVSFAEVRTPPDSERPCDPGQSTRRGRGMTTWESGIADPPHPESVLGRARDARRARDASRPTVPPNPLESPPNGGRPDPVQPDPSDRRREPAPTTDRSRLRVGAGPINVPGQGLIFPSAVVAA